jgi:hypothetical protein
LRDDRLREFGPVEHRKVGALSGQRRQMRGVAQQRHPGRALPSMSGRESVEHAQGRCDPPVGDQRSERRRPSLEFGRDPPGRRVGIGEVDAGEPLHGAVQRDISVKDGVRLTVREDPLSRSERKQGAAADRLGRLRMPRVRVMQISLNERRADIFGLGVRQQRADLRPGAVSADEKFGFCCRPVGEGQRVPTVAKRRDFSELLSPLDRLKGQGLKEYPPEVAPENLGSAARAVVGLLEHQGAMPVEHARGLATRVDNGAERVGEAGRRERGLPIWLMDVELATLCASGCRRLGLIDCRGDIVDVEDAGEDEPAETGADDRDGSHHRAAFKERWERCFMLRCESEERIRSLRKK